MLRRDAHLPGIVDDLVRRRRDSLAHRIDPIYDQSVAQALAAHESRPLPLAPRKGQRG